MESTTTDTETIAGRYSKLIHKRQEYIDRARECAALTIPSLFPKDSVGAARGRLSKVYNSLAAEGVKMLGSKLLIGAFPPNVPFFKHQMDAFKTQIVMQQNGKEGAAAQALMRYDKAVQMEFEAKSYRNTLSMAFRHLLIAGNGLIYIDPKTGKSRFLPLTRYVVQRDPMGAAVEVIVEEEISIQLLPDDVYAAVRKNLTEDERKLNDMTVKLYTQVRRDRKGWMQKQEVKGVPVKEGSGRYKPDECPWLPLRLIPVDGEAYGRSFVEEHYGDVRSLELLSKAIVQHAAACAKIVFLVAPNSTTKPKALAKAESGDFVSGRRADVETLSVEKYNDFQVAERVAMRIEERLSRAFMLTSAVRKAERVTAEEVRAVLQELETAIAGIHAILSEDLQLPLVRLIIARMNKNNGLPELPKEVVKPTVVTGIEALGRGNDLTNLGTALNVLAPFPTVMERVKPGELADRVFASAGVDTDGLIATDDEIAEQQQQAQMQQMMQDAAPGVAQEATKGVVAAATQPEAQQ